MLIKANSLIRTALVLTGLSFSIPAIDDARAEAVKLSTTELNDLQSVAAWCAGSNNEIPDQNTCLNAEKQLVAHYGSREAYLEAIRKLDNDNKSR